MRPKLSDFVTPPNMLWIKWDQNDLWGTCLNLPIFVHRMSECMQCFEAKRWSKLIFDATKDKERKMQCQNMRLVVGKMKWPIKRLRWTSRLTTLLFNAALQFLQWIIWFLCQKITTIFCFLCPIWSDIFQELTAEILGGAECRLVGRPIVKYRKYSAMLNIN